LGANEKTFAIIALSGIIGIIFAIILQLLNGMGMDMALFLSNNVLSLPQLQLLIIVIAEVFGIFLAAMQT
jgi:hypothetical protein